MFDPFSQQSQGPVPPAGNPPWGHEFAQGGPLDGLQNQLANVLNYADPPTTSTSRAVTAARCTRSPGAASRRS
jgi:hypothetical protein